MNEISADTWQIYLQKDKRKPYMLQFQWPLPDVTLGVGPQMNKFEQESSNHHQISLAGEGVDP